MKRKRFLSKKLLISVIVIFSIFIPIFLFSYYIINNYKTFLSKFGVEEKCKVVKSSIVCEYINIKSTNYSLESKDVEIQLNLKDYLTGKTEKLAFISVNKMNINLLKKESTRKSSLNSIRDFLKYSFLILSKSKISINEINIKGENFSVKNLSIKTDANNIETKKTATVSIYNKTFLVEYLKLTVLEDSLKVNSILRKSKDLLLEITGEIDANGNGYVKGKIHADRYKEKYFALTGFLSNFEARAKSFKDISFFIDFSVDSIENKYGIFENLKGNVKGNLNEALTAILKLKLKTAYTANNIYIKNLSLESSIKTLKDINKFTSENKISIPYLETSNFYVHNIKSNFYVNRESLLKGKGAINANIASAEFDFTYSSKTKELNIKNLNFWLKDIINAAKKQNKIHKDLLKVNFLTKGNINIDLDKQKFSYNLHLEGINLYGVHFNFGNITGKTTLENLYSDISIKLKNQSSFLLAGIKLNKQEVSGNLSYQNVDLKNLIWLKKSKIQIKPSGTGVISGTLNSPLIELFGFTNKFKYKQIEVPFVKYHFKYKDKKIYVTASSRESVKSNTTININPLDVKIKIKLKKADGRYIENYLKSLSPKIFSKIKPKEMSGSIDIRVRKNKFLVSINVPSSKIYLNPVENIFFASVNGKISNKEIYINSTFGKENFIYKGFDIKHIEGKLRLKNNELSVNLIAKDSKSSDKLDITSNFFTNIKSKRTKFSLYFNAKKKGLNLYSSIHLSGKLENLKGNLSYALIKEKDFLISHNTINLETTLDHNFYTIKANKELLSFSFPEKINLDLENPKLRIRLNDKLESLLFIKNIVLKKRQKEVLNIKGILAEIDEEKIYFYPVYHVGILKGKVKELRFTFKEKKLSLLAEGKIDRFFLNQILKVVSVYGNAEYKVKYKGSIQNFLTKVKAQLKSKRLKVRNNFLIGYIHIENLSAILNSGILSIKVRGKSSEGYISQGKVKLDSKAIIKKQEIFTNIKMNQVPVRILSMFRGKVSSELNIYYNNKEKRGEIGGDILVSGSTVLDTDKLIKNSKTTQDRQLENIKLDINIYSFLPIYIFGQWGKAYAEVKGRITGNLALPIFNGEINIIYGEINYMKNNFNIDFASIKIVNNIPYINARLSTYVANTHIFIDITGAAPDDLRFELSSTPPKAKEEIMAILLLRDSPGFIEDFPVFSAIGTLLKSVLPLDRFLISEDSSSGFLNTGFEVSIAPRYSPTEGIVATIYAKRDITRRIFIALSKPISQSSTQTLVGWYEAGFRLTETSSIFTRLYEDGMTETGIIFNFPFDF